jgi:hypothetical protein
MMMTFWQWPRSWRRPKPTPEEAAEKERMKQHLEDMRQRLRALEYLRRVYTRDHDKES